MFVVYTQVYRRRRNRTFERTNECNGSGQSKNFSSPQPPPSSWTKGEPWSADSVHHDASIQYRSSFCGNTIGCALYVYFAILFYKYRQVQNGNNWVCNSRYTSLLTILLVNRFGKLLMKWCVYNDDNSFNKVKVNSSIEIMKMNLYFLFKKHWKIIVYIL